MKRPMQINFKALLFGICYALLCSLPAYGDDTEIYLAPKPTSAGTALNNILFILDTSGSMSTKVGSGTGATSRMANMQQAFATLMGSTSNVNVGLMRFNNPGGPVLFPVSNIDSTASTTSSISSSIVSHVAASSDDVEEMSSGTIDLTSPTLDMAYGAPAGGSVTRQVQISVDADDATETVSAHTVTTGDNSLVMNSTNMNGFRFRSVNVPKDATIESATLVFTPDTSSSSNVTFRFSGELASSSAAFTNTAPNKLSNRTTTAGLSPSVYVDWTPGAWSRRNANSESTTPDLKTIIQKIVNQTGWVANNNLAILQTYVSGSGSRSAYSHDGANTNSGRYPTLNITYSTVPQGQETIGLRFLNVGVPKGATVTSATIDFTASGASSGTTNLTVKAEASDDAPTYNSTASSVTARAKTAASVTWAPTNWNDADVVQTPDLTTLVQEVVNRASWCGGNAMAFQLTGTDIATRIAQSYDGDPSLAPVLRVTYDPTKVPATGSCLIQDLIYRVSTSASDAAQSGSSMDLTSSTMAISSSRTNGLRFNGIMINQGATIENATLEFTAVNPPRNGSNSGTASITIKGEASDNASAFSNTNNNITGRTTTGSVTWSPGNWNSGGIYASSDIKTIIQNIVNRGGWAPGNSLALIQTASSGTRYASTYDGNSATAALLRLKVKTDGIAITTTKKVRDALIDIVNDFVPGGFTPIVDTLYEGAQYYRGGPVKYGLNRGAETTYGRVSNSLTWDQSTGTLVRATGCTDDNLNASACKTEKITGTPTYISPITSECTGNYIVLLTDGEANHNNSETLIKNLTSGSCANRSNSDENCGVELATFLNTEDQSPTAVPNTYDTKGQHVSTYTISFNNDGGSGAVSFLDDLAKAGGGGKHYEASSATDLVAVFNSILQNIAAANSTFIAPTATVNQFNRLTNRNELYFSLFKAGGSPVWAGNLKRYGIDPANGNILDVNGALAADPVSGFFNKSSTSWWSTVQDGDNVELGGAAGMMTNTRKVYTNPTADANVSLSATANALSEGNANITKAMLNISTWPDTNPGGDSNNRQDLLKWARGVDVLDSNGDTDFTDARLEMGDPVHSKPVVINYSTSASTEDSTVYIGTNQGYLHAFSTTTGAEVFSFVPRELLSNLHIFYENTAGTTHPDGLDGPITYWYGNNQVPTSSDHAYLYVGMRRGGRNYYSLDVTDRSVPILKWTIFGGTSGTMGDFSELGETWSSPKHAKVKIAGTTTDVLIFGGGYDESEDTKTIRSADGQGRAIYIVDATTGYLKWSGGAAATGFTKQFTDMNYAIPSDVQVIDINGDGLADRLYVGDMGGQLWRLDIDNTNTNVSSLVKGGVIADLNDGTAAGNRRFYYAPDISLISSATPSYLAISIGSGWRAHPLDTTVQDRFYMIKDKDIYNPPTSYTKLTENSLYDTTANVIGESTGQTKADAIAALASKEGWYIRLENSGEKVLAESSTINKQVVFTTYQPGSSTSSSNSCQLGAGTGRLYVVSVLDGTPTENLDGSGSDTELTASDRSKILTFSGIPPSLTTLFLNSCDGDGNNCVIKPVALEELEHAPINFGQIDYKTYWQEVR